MVAVNHQLPRGRAVRVAQLWRVGVAQLWRVGVAQLLRMGVALAVQLLVGTLAELRNHAAN